MRFRGRRRRGGQGASWIMLIRFGEGPHFRGVDTGQRRWPSESSQRHLRLSKLSILTLILLSLASRQRTAGVPLARQNIDMQPPTINQKTSHPRSRTPIYTDISTSTPYTASSLAAPGLTWPPPIPAPQAYHPTVFSVYC